MRLLLAAILLATPVAAQPLASDGKLSAGGGVGVVVNPATCSFCSGGMWPALTYRFARTMRYDAVLAFEGVFSQWSGAPGCTGSGCLREPDARFIVATHTVSLQWYPRVDQPIFVKLGVGASTNHARYTFGVVNATEPAERQSVTVVSLTPKIGVGVERRVSPQVSFSLHADAVRAVRGRIAAGDASLSATLLYLGASFTWYQ